MPYRESEYVEHCTSCGADTRAMCQRCLKPACAAHLFTDEAVCEPCESEFLALRPRVRGSSFMLSFAGYAVFGAGALMLVTVGSVVGLGVALAGGALFVAGIATRRRQISRAEFVRKLHGGATRSLDAPG